jgi:hypothetical protein
MSYMREVEDMAEANRLFLQAHDRALRRRLWRTLLRKPTTVACLVGDGAPPGGGRAGRPAGLQTVPVSQIRGSEGRCHGFDPEFDPLDAHDRRRWRQMCFDVMRGVVLPPVELLQVGEVYYVRDGHHRISVARALGQLQIEAEVIVLEPPAEGKPVAAEPGPG